MIQVIWPFLLKRYWQIKEIWLVQYRTVPWKFYLAVPWKWYGIGPMTIYYAAVQKRWADHSFFQGILLPFFVWNSYIRGSYLLRLYMLYILRSILDICIFISWHIGMFHSILVCLYFHFLTYYRTQCIVLTLLEFWTCQNSSSLL